MPQVATRPKSPSDTGHTTTTFRMPDDLNEWVVQAAEEDGRKKGAFIRRVLELERKRREEDGV